MPELKWFTTDQICREVEKLLRDERGALYVAATLDIPLSKDVGCALNIETPSIQFQKDADGILNEKMVEMTPELRLLICQAYIKFKSPSHHFYMHAKEYVKQHEPEAAPPGVH